MSIAKTIDIISADQGVLPKVLEITPAPADKTTAWNDAAGAKRTGSWNTASTPDAKSASTDNGTIGKF